MLPSRLKSLRLSHNMTQKELSAHLNVTPKVISFYELGQRRPPHEALVKIASMFNVSVDYLLGITDDSSALPKNLHRVTSSQANLNKIPYFDSIRCGLPENYVDGTCENFIECPAGVDATFAVKAEGDSMNALGILDGDTVFIREQHDFEDGDTMAVCLGDSVVLKKCYHFEGGLRLKSANTENKYADQIYSAEQLEDKTAHIIGKLVFSHRAY